LQDAKSVDILIALLEDAGEHPMVRHEAAEALGAIATERCLQPLREHQDDVAQEVRETCRLALRRVEDVASKRTSPSTKFLRAPSLPSLPTTCCSPGRLRHN
jgi:deoxyhypusine monooxygenase